MTSEGEAQKTSEFLRRRKLRLQQVREQSKDIAKKIRLRAKVENLKQVVGLDEKKEREYIQSQEKLVNKLQELYSRGLDNVGSSHKQALKVTQPDTSVKKPDLSHVRGREAAAELKRQKQQKLDELKKSLDRKIQAREAANVLSREKSATATTKLCTKSSGSKPKDEGMKLIVEEFIGDDDVNDKDLPAEVVKNDMGTQWDNDLLPPEWGPAVPALSIPQDESVRGSVGDSESNADKQKRPNLFALSNEMPLSLRGGTHPTCDTGPFKHSSTLVSEYIQNRALRLRETEVVNSSKKHSEDLKNLRQTITRTRPLKPEGSAFSNICHVVEGQMIPVPMWHCETGYQCETPRILQQRQTLVSKPFANVSHSDIDKIFSSIRPPRANSPCPVLRKTRPFIPHKCNGHYKLSGIPASDAFQRAQGSENFVAKKKAVTTYNHSTRDSRDVARAAEQVVRRAGPAERDAYSQALSETAAAATQDAHKRSQQPVNRIAVTRQNVEKEYEDTIAFLNSLPKNKNIRPIKNAFKDDHRLQAQRESRQRILQHEFRNIERESRSGPPGRQVQSKLPDGSRAKRPKSPSDLNVENTFNERDFQYSWMPIPESDSNLAVHTIPTGVRARAAGSVKFSRVDSYHEYRSRHKHTPPTKDTALSDNKPKLLLETVTYDQDNNSLSGLSPSDNSSAECPESDPKENNIQNNNARKELTDEERIIIYKILSCKHRKRNKLNKNNGDEVSRGNGDSNDTANGKSSKLSSDASSEQTAPKEHSARSTENTNPLDSEIIKEGVYEVAANTEDNLESMYYAELDKKESEKNGKSDKRKQGSLSFRNKPDARSENQKSRKKCSSSKCQSQSMDNQPAEEATPSALKKSATQVALGPSPETGFVKLVDDGGKQEGNFYIGATGFLKDDAYEVIIQLRKKETLKEISKKEDEKTTVAEKASEVAETTEAKDAKLSVAESGDNVQPKEAEKFVQSEVSEGHAKPKSTGDDLCPVQADSQSTFDPGPVTANCKPIEKSSSNEKLGVISEISAEVPPPKVMHDRSVSTSFKDTYPLTEPLAKSDPITATSTYTQTTLGSPNPRPVYIHMSSSTSTAYMSPPEMIFPTCFKRDNDPCKKVYRSPRKIDKSDDRNLIYEECHCRKRSSSKNFKEKVTESDTNRSFERDVGRGTYNVYRIIRDSTPSSPASNQRNKRSSTCKSRGDSRSHCKHHSRKSRHQLLTAKPSMSIWNSKSAILRNKRSKTNDRYSKLSNKSYLSPIIKEYIHKLLSLNREGIKAIQVDNQDCSSVNTPTSSIINIPTNLTAKTSHRTSLDSVNRDFSLEQMKNILKQHILLNVYRKFCHPDVINKAENAVPGKIKLRKKKTKKKMLHKVKSLNVSKKILIMPCDASTNTKHSNETKQQPSSNVRRQGSPPSDHEGRHGETDVRINIVNAHSNSKMLHKPNNRSVSVEHSAGQAAITICSGDSTSKRKDIRSQANSNGQQPINTSTQTNCSVDGEINFIKLAEDKLQNMEKIADLTEKCTKRLSNLAKVLEEVRKNKSLAYSKISSPDSTSDSDQKSENAVAPEVKELKSPHNIATECSKEYYKDSTDCESLLSGAPKHESNECPEMEYSKNVSSNCTNTEFTCGLATPVAASEECRVHNNTKPRNKPPPALLRINLRHPQENVVPHELSTVIEVDSPLSVKFKSQTSVTNTNQSKNLTETKKDENFNEKLQTNPELFFSIGTKSKGAGSSDDSKLQMMDLNQFNEIMLRPFISLQEYAQDYCKENMNSKRDSICKDHALTDDISSLHSDGSLPDVVAELLKRKIITEPFRFDTASNVNSTTLSSESTLSILALSKVPKERCKSKLTDHKENVGETSDSLSISSNPDLENAFKKLGMGWASSTLKKTKERLALSSSSNTSSSSLSHIKFKNASKHDALVNDSVSFVANLSNKPVLKHQLDVSKDAEQQTSFTNSMTVKEFLTKELAKKITFTDKSDKNDTNQGFVSLFDTKVPDEMKKASQTLQDDNSGGSAPSGNNNRARTSTPVNIFKSVTYHSSSSSNISNGLFSNADDLSSVKLTSTSMRYQSTSEKDELTIPNCSLKMRKDLSDCSKTDSC